MTERLKQKKLVEGRKNDGGLTRRRLMASVYPERWVHGILGYGSVDWNTAIEVAAVILAVAAEENAGAFTREEWSAIGSRFCRINRGRNEEARLATNYRAPGSLLAAYMSDKPSLAEKLSKLDYTHSWAVLRAAAWRGALDGYVGPNDDWWLPSYWDKKLAELYEWVE